MPLLCARRAVRPRGRQVGWFEVAAAAFVLPLTGTAAASAVAGDQVEDAVAGF